MHQYRFMIFFIVDDCGSGFDLFVLTLLTTLTILRVFS